VESLAWTSDWAWGLPLIALTLTCHIAAVIGIAVLLEHGRIVVERRRTGRHDAALLAIAAIGVAGLTLAVLHGLDATIWAAVYLLLGAFGTLSEAMLYSMDSMTTHGSPGLRLAHQWQLMGALESVNGVLLFGISTAFLTATISQLWSWMQRGADPPQSNRTSQ
jgi:hypothetical protein